MASAVNKIIFYISNKVIITAFVILIHFHELQPEQKLIMNVEKSTGPISTLYLLLFNCCWQGFMTRSSISHKI